MCKLVWKNKYLTLDTASLPEMADEGVVLQSGAEAARAAEQFGMSEDINEN
jgi:hypothetical protein